MRNASSEMEKAMQSLQGMERAEAPPFFTGKVMQRISAIPGRWELAARFVTRPAVWAVCLVFILMVNAFLYFGNGNAEAAKEETAYELYSLTDYRTFLSDTEP